jgi:hypothetical protein
MRGDNFKDQAPMAGDNSQVGRPQHPSGNHAPQEGPDRPPRTLLRRADQLGIAALALFALVAIGGYWLDQAVLRERLIDIEKASPLDAGFRVDINSADWSGATSLQHCEIG